MLFQWFAMFAYWQYIAFALGRSLFGTADASSAAFRQAVLVTGQAGALYNFVAFIAAVMAVIAGVRPGICMIAAP